MAEPLISSAEAFARRKHADQKRKYTGEPYAVHLDNVAQIVASVGGSREMIAAAWLHDVVEDTPTTVDEIGAIFGARVRTLVYYLTDVSRPEDGNREARKAIDRAHLAGASPDAKTIKLADLIDNTSSIVAHDKNFARVYLAEKEALLEVLIGGDQRLLDRAYEVLRDAQRALVQHSLEKAEHGIR